MVSTIPSSGTQNPPLSYADKVKKAQGIPSTSAPASSASSSRPPPRTAAAQPSTASPPAPKPVASTPPVRNAQETTQQESPVASAVPSPTISADLNGDPTAPTGEPSSASASKAVSPPVVNVWNVRIAQQKARAAPRPPSEPSSSAPQNPAHATANISVSSNTVHSAPSKAFTGPSQSNGRNGHIASPVNGNEVKSRKPRDPKEPSQPSQAPTAPLPSLEDANAWPEMGKPATPVSSASKRSGKDREEHKETSNEREEETTLAQKKNERPKWVPIPAEELQAAADAQRAGRSQGSAHGRSRSHQQSQNRSQGLPSVSTSPAGSTSDQDSQNRTRAQSSGTRGDRRSGSRAGSTTQSRTQSRAGSLQSSPKYSAVRRRLPEEVSGASGTPSSRSLRSSRAASPHIPSPYIQDTGITVPMARQITPFAYSARSESPFYASTGSVGHVPSPYTTTPVINSPAAPAYHLPPGAYAPPPPLSPYPVPQYQPYPSYAYGYGQPYMFWGGSSSGPQSQNISQAHSPATYPVQLSSAQEMSPPVLSASLPPSLPVSHDISMNGFTSVQPSQASSHSSASEKARPRVLSFGSIDIASSVTPETSASILPSNSSHNVPTESIDTAAPTLTSAIASSTQTDAVTDKLFPAFSVGLAPGDPGPSRKRGISGLSPVVPPQAQSAVSSNDPEHQDILPAATSLSKGQSEENIDVLTAKTKEMSLKEPKWEFGSTTVGEDGADPASATALPGQVHVDPSESQATLIGDIPLVPDDPRLRLAPLDHLDDPAGLPTPVPASATALYAANAPLSPGDEWKVRDYGYGMGRPRGSAPFVPREDRVPRDGGMTYNTRPRRGSYNGEPFERGAYSGRRGRGRGWGRGRGAYSGDGYVPRPPRGMSRQAYSPSMGGPSVPYDTTYYAVPPPGSYSPVGYEVYAPYSAYGSPPQPLPVAPPTAQSTAPVPVPITKLSFPLDPLRYYILGQLEYYLSDDNLAHDLYLRKNMDDRGWISIPLIASFNRVKQLTYELQLVKDMLTISSLVEVKGDWVRMHRWERYVLPDAPPSPLEGDIVPPANFAHQANVLVHPPFANSGSPLQHLDAGQPETHYSASQGLSHVEGEDGEDEDEDEVEFVLGGDANQSWTSDRNES